MAVTISPKYQVVIPVAARRLLQLKPGMQVDVVVKGKVAYLVPVGAFEDVQRATAGRLNHHNLRDKDDRAL